jgi:glycosyltransferase involved in cell wall biosynthesis
LKIAHVVTLVSVDGAYGGPVAVARVQCEALAEMGHDVTLFAGWDGQAELEVPGVHVRLFRVRRALPGSGFSALRAPGLSNALVDVGTSFDMVHVHLARDLVTLPAAHARARQRRCFVIQTHGMVRPDRRLRALMLDALLTRRVLRATSAQLVLTDQEQRDAPRVARAPITSMRVRNGVRPSDLQAEWAIDMPEVIYCARLHERKRPTAFVRMAADMVQRGIPALFTIAGPDEGQLAAVKNLIDELGLSGRVSYIGALQPSAVLARLSRAQVYVLPSVDEPFPMSVLEAMSVGVPAVITDSSGISSELASTPGVVVTDGSASAMADAVEHLLSSVAVWEAASSAARAEVLSRYSADAAGRFLDALYLTVGPRATSS